jgi:hypothetical protein
MPRVTTHVLAALTQVVMDTSLCLKKIVIMFCQTVVIWPTIFLFFPLYVSHAQAMNPKVCKISHKKKTLVGGGGYKI